MADSEQKATKKGKDKPKKEKKEKKHKDDDAEEEKPVFVYGKETSVQDKELDALFSAPVAAPLPQEPKKQKKAAKKRKADSSSESDDDKDETESEEDEDKKGAGWMLPGKSDEQLDLEANTEKAARTVFVGNLPVDCKSQNLEKFFGKHGKVESVRIRGVHLMKKLMSKKASAILREEHASEESNMNAYVVFETPEAAQSALESNGVEFMGHHIRVDSASSSGVYDRHRSVFVGNIPFNATEEQVMSFFKDCGKVEAVRIIRDKTTSIGKGFGYVLFEDKESVALALTKDGQAFRDRPIRVSNVERPREKRRPQQSAELAAGAARRVAEKSKKREGEESNTSTPKRTKVSDGEDKSAEDIGGPNASAKGASSNGATPKQFKKGAVSPASAIVQHIGSGKKGKKRIKIDYSQLPTDPRLRRKALKKLKKQAKREAKEERAKIPRQRNREKYDKNKERNKKLKEQKMQQAVQKALQAQQAKSS